MRNKCFVFFLRNFRALRKVRKITSTKSGELLVEAGNPTDLPRIQKIYRKLNGSGRLGFCKFVLILFFSRQLCVVARRENEIVGFELFYFNPLDIEQGTVHEGFVGVVPEEQGNGIGTSLRMKAGEHFSENGFSGISSRIDVDNHSSLRSSEKLGFFVQDTYFDREKGVERYYMIWNFNGTLRRE